MSLAKGLSRRRRRGREDKDADEEHSNRRSVSIHDNLADASKFGVDVSDPAIEAIASDITDPSDIFAGNARSRSQQNMMCRCGDTVDSHQSYLPRSPPTAWRHRPLLIRPAPESSMKVLGVRYSSSDEYIPEYSCCSLPINNGTESDGKCLVIDFTTELFVGTAIFRIKLNSTRPDKVAGGEEPTANTYYFQGRKRTFQAVIRGRFIEPNISMSECVTGQMFHRPAKKLPPKVILHGAVSIFQTLAPQLTVDFDGKRPKFLSPLVSTAQTVIANTQRSPGGSIEAPLTEPHPSDMQSLHQDLLKCNNTPLPRTDNTVRSRIKARKRAFDRNYAHNVKQPTFDTSKEYTFEFFQHLLLFDDFAVDLGKVFGKHKLNGVLNGQPLKCMAARYVVEEDSADYLWNFDIWHEKLYADAMRI